MRPELTPAVERALAAAARWRGAVDDPAAGLPQVLLGLLSESECRAAGMLARHGVTQAAVKRRWPHLKRRRQVAGDGNGDSHGQSVWPAAVRPCLASALARLPSHEASLAIATEHLLLGMASGDDETALWLREQGLDPEELAREIETLYGISLEPAPMPATEHVAEVVRSQCSPPSPNSDDFGDALPQNPNSGEFGYAAQPEGWTPAEGSNSGEVGSVLRDSVSTLRLLDAAANRAREGLRVVEDYARFVRDDRFLMRELKQLRHDLTAALARLPADQLLICRDTVGDIGTTVSTEAENSRVDPAAVAAASFKRLQEALRSLAEFGKLVDPAFAAQIEQLRYRSYTLERVCRAADRSQRRLEASQLYVLVDGRASSEAFEQLAAGLIEAGVQVLQLRDKRLDDRQLLARALRLRELTRGTSTLFLMNDRPDLAALAEADGVHVGQEELRVNDARRIVGPEMLIGVSTHSIEQARQAVLDGADYLGLGPTFPSGTKRFEHFPGLDFLRKAAAEMALPAFAIGGITPENLAQVLATGIRRVAVGQAIMAAANPAEAARGMISAMKGFESHQ